MTINHMTGFMDERVEELFVSSEYNLFVLTGQITTPDSLKNGVAAKPFNTITDPSLMMVLQENAKPIEHASRLTVSFNKAQGCLTVIDTRVGTEINVPLTLLDAEVQQKLYPQDAFVNFAQRVMAPA